MTRCHIGCNLLGKLSAAHYVNDRIDFRFPGHIQTDILIVVIKQVVIVGNDRSYVCAIITGDVPREHAEAAIERCRA